MKYSIISLGIIILCILISSCGNNSSDDASFYDDIVGSWYGTRTYYNPVGGTKHQYLTIRFENNGLGSLEYESPVSYSVAKFTYSVKNKIVTCNGAYANTYGDVDSGFKMTLRIDGDRLVPLDKYTSFILTRDNSVMTDGDGNEYVDNGSMLYGVWLHDSGEVVLVLDESKYTEYTLMSASSNIYSKKTEGSFSYNQLGGYVLINGYRYDVLTLSETLLQLKSENNNVFNYMRGTYNDIPTNGENSGDYRSILENAKMGWSDTRGDIIIKFYDTDQIFYGESSSKTLGSMGRPFLDARGTYSISGKTINACFTSVTWESGDYYAKDYFPGWIYGKICYKSFTIESINVDRLTLSLDGKTYYLYNVLSKN